MTSEELRLAKLSKTLNNSAVIQLKNTIAGDSAYKETILNLKKTLKQEKSQQLKDLLNYNINLNAKLTEEDIKKQAIKHHSLVLEAQIKENELKKRIKRESPEFHTPVPTPSTPTNKNFQLRADLLKQIKEKELKKQQDLENEIKFSRKMIENSKKLLNDEYESKANAKQKAFQEMVSSWEDNIRVKNMKKNLEKLMFFGPPAEPVKVVPETEENPAEKHVKTQSVPRPLRQIDRQFDWKKNLRNSSVKSESSKVAGKSFNSIIEQFSTLNDREKRLKHDKNKLLKYFEEKIKEKKQIRLPKIV